MGEGRQKWVTEDLQRQKKKGNVQLHLEPWSLLHCPFPCRCNFYLSHFFFLSITSPPLHLHRPLLAAPVLSVCYWERNGFRCTKKKKKPKTDLRTHKRERSSRGGGSGGVDCISVKLLYCVAPQMYTRRCSDRRAPDLENIMSASLKHDTHGEVSANKQTIGIIRRPAALHIFKWVGYMQICTSLFKKCSVRARQRRPAIRIKRADGKRNNQFWSGSEPWKPLVPRQLCCMSPALCPVWYEAEHPECSRLIGE